jgi:hypothetical protein
MTTNRELLDIADRVAYVCGQSPTMPFVTNITGGQLLAIVAHYRKLRAAVEEHRTQRADDRCVADDDLLYAALGDGRTCDRRVGDKMAMLANCARFIDRRCEGGGWPTYAELEQQLAELRPPREKCAAPLGICADRGACKTVERCIRASVRDVRPLDAIERLAEIGGEA